MLLLMFNFSSPSPYHPRQTLAGVVRVSVVVERTIRDRARKSHSISNSSIHSLWSWLYLPPRFCPILVFLPPHSFWWSFSFHKPTPRLYSRCNTLVSPNCITSKKNILDATVAQGSGQTLLDTTPSLWKSPLHLRISTRQESK